MYKEQVRGQKDFKSNSIQKKIVELEILIWGNSLRLELEEVRPIR